MEQSRTQPWLGTPVESTGIGSGTFGTVRNIATKKLVNPQIGESDAFFIRTPEDEVFVNNTHESQPLPLQNAQNTENDLGTLVRIEGDEIKFVAKRLKDGKPICINVALLKDPRIKPFLIYTPSAENTTQTIMQKLISIPKKLETCRNKDSLKKQYIAWGKRVIGAATECKILLTDNKPENTACAEIRPSTWEFRLIDLDGIQSGKEQDKDKYSEALGSACLFNKNMFQDTIVINTLAFVLNAYASFYKTMGSEENTKNLFNACMQLCNDVLGTGLNPNQRFAEEFAAQSGVRILSEMHTQDAIFVAKYIINTFLEGKYLSFSWNHILIAKTRSRGDLTMAEPQ